MASERSVGGGCIPFLFCGTFLILLALKLAEVGQVATWSWWAVTAPLWGLVVAFLALVVVLVLVAMLVYAVTGRELFK